MKIERWWVHSYRELQRWKWKNKGESRQKSFSPKVGVSSKKITFVYYFLWPIVNYFNSRWFSRNNILTKEIFFSQGYQVTQQLFLATTIYSCYVIVYLYYNISLFCLYTPCCWLEFCLCISVENHHTDGWLFSQPFAKPQKRFVFVFFFLSEYDFHPVTFVLLLTSHSTSLSHLCLRWVAKFPSF